LLDRDVDDRGECFLAKARKSGKFTTTGAVLGFSCQSCADAATGEKAMTNAAKMDASMQSSYQRSAIETSERRALFRPPAAQADQRSGIRWGTAAPLPTLHFSLYLAPAQRPSREPEEKHMYDTSDFRNGLKIDTITALRDHRVHHPRIIHARVSRT